ncbi:hypothetical protein [Actinoplanes sp. NPDC049118]|uniref:hypothetical protein n=1 Tax=Actinoplanes sp. NPDC049118 TaxID=3155769 RepID=UPI0033F8688F
MLHTGRAAGRDALRADQARHFVRELEETLAHTPNGSPVVGLDRISAADRTATVTCVVDVRGEFVDLSIGGDWWHTVGPAGIASAILDAVRAAQERAMLAAALMRRQGRTIPSSMQGDPFGFGEAQPDPPADIAAEWVAAQAKVERGYTLMRRADRVIEFRDSPQPRTIAGPRGLFRLTLVGFSVTHSEVNPHGLSPSDTDRLADDAREALRQATREQDPAYWLSGEGTRR